jgi:hypothetical protein
MKMLTVDWAAIGMMTPLMPVKQAVTRMVGTAELVMMDREAV